jgi:hypothetical protein
MRVPIVLLLTLAVVAQAIALPGGKYVKAVYLEPESVPESTANKFVSANEYAPLPDKIDAEMVDAFPEPPVGQFTPQFKEGTSAEGGKLERVRVIPGIVHEAPLKKVEIGIVISKKVADGNVSSVPSGQVSATPAPVANTAAATAAPVANKVQASTAAPIVTPVVTVANAGM